MDFLYKMVQTPDRRYEGVVVGLQETIGGDKLWAVKCGGKTRYFKNGQIELAAQP